MAAFACSVYAQTSSNTRMTKPFNPLLGETYECDRRAERGWRCLLEQVHAYTVYIYIHSCSYNAHVHLHVDVDVYIVHVHVVYSMCS